MTFKETIANKLQTALTPTHLVVLNESYKHSVPAGSELHFNVTIVSERFEGKTLLERHRDVNTLLTDEFRAGVHALTLCTLTPQEWRARDGLVIESPPCLGGFKHENRKE